MLQVLEERVQKRDWSITSKQTGLRKFGLNVRRPAIRVLLTQQQVHYMLYFARAHIKWTIRDWTSVGVENAK